MVDKVNEEVEVGKKESGIIHGREKKVDSKRRDMQVRIYKKSSRHLPMYGSKYM